MLSEIEEQIHRYNPDADVTLHGQELNPESYAICLGDMLIKGQDASHIVHGNSLSNDGHVGERFHYCIANPPSGVDWSKVEESVRDEHESLGFDGRFGPGLPRKSDGQLLFLLHLLSKLRTPEEGGGRLAIVHNGSPLFTGAAGSGESEIRRYLLEHDLLEAIVALPEQLFYNTGIASYVWLVTNRKTPERQGRVQRRRHRRSRHARRALHDSRRPVAGRLARAVARAREPPGRCGRVEPDRRPAGPSDHHGARRRRRDATDETGCGERDRADGSRRDPHATQRIGAQPCVGSRRPSRPDRRARRRRRLDAGAVLRSRPPT